ncbi:MAG: hypothetical protein HY660_06505 [Armatimonadetes bacterium]|nr:hypothetical protein [Armatimonadota bacterium]
MRRRLHWPAGFLLLVTAILLLPPGGLAQEGPLTMPLAQVRVGMKGVGRTVIQGIRVEDYPVEILGVLDAGGGRQLIMFRITGPVLERLGGTAQGMSGSPLYVNGRIIGAHGFSLGNFRGPDANVGLATPIEEMLKLLEGGTAGDVHPRVYVSRQPIRVNGRAITRVVIADSTAQAEAINAAGPPGVAAASPAAVPLTAWGLGPRAFELLTHLMARHNVIPVQGPTTGRGGARFPEAPLEPGSAIGVEVVRGDVGFGAVGTLSYRHGNKILAFAHPMLNAGAAEYALTNAYVHTIIRSTQHPFKLGEIGSMVGRVTMDRSAGLGGEIGRLPRFFNVRVTVRTADNKTLRMGAQVVRRRDLASNFVPVILASAIEQAMDEAGEGTARVKITMRARGLPRNLVRENVFYSGRNIAAAAALDLPEAVQFAFNNEFRTVDPMDMAVEVEVDRRRRTATIMDAQVAAREVRAGGIVRVRIRVRPFQQAEQISRIIEVPVPRNFPTGPAVLVIRSAGASGADGLPVEERFKMMVAQEPRPLPAEDFAQAIELFESAGKNTDLLLQVVPFGFPQLGSTDANFLNFDAFAMRTIPTDWVILGSFQIPLIIR